LTRARPFSPLDNHWTLTQRLRRKVQYLTAFLANPYLIGFAHGTIYQGNAKLVCVPFLNCYSCPGAIFSCPVGAIQAIAGGVSYRLSLYVVGFLLAAGSVLGRFICGWLCPFGLIQELLAGLSKTKLRFARVLTYPKYAIMALLVPTVIAWGGVTGTAVPLFCKYLCPAGTLEGGIPLVGMDLSLRALTGVLFQWKVAVLAVIMFASVYIYRPFCRGLCPLGAFHGLLNGVALVSLNVNRDRCTACGLCSEACPLDLDLPDRLNDPECIRCLRCLRACPQEAVQFSRRSEQSS